LIASLGTGYAPGTIHTVLLAIRYKVFDKVQLFVADFGRVKVGRGTAVHQNRLPFSLLLSFGQIKEGGNPAQAKKENAWYQRKEMMKELV